MATRSRGNGTNFGWLRKSCDISTCDLSPDGVLMLAWSTWLHGLVVMEQISVG